MDSTLAKGLAVLEWLARQQRPCRVAEVAQAFGLARSNAHRTLQTLVACGWAVQEPSTAYRTGLRMFELGALGAGGADLRPRLRSFLEAVAAETGETIHLTALDGADTVYLDKVDSPMPVAAYSRIGGRAPAYCVASGKALLAAAQLAPAALQSLLGELQAHTPNTITSIDELNTELERTRARGYAENREEWRTGVCGLGVPVFDALGRPVAAIGMSVPSIRFARARARTLAERLAACGADASRSLGYNAHAGDTAPTPPPQRRQR